MLASSSPTSTTVLTRRDVVQPSAICTPGNKAGACSRPASLERVILPIFSAESLPKSAQKGGRKKHKRNPGPVGSKVSCTPAGDQQDGELQAVWFELLEVTIALQVAVKIHTLEQATEDETSPLGDGGSKKRSGTCMDTKETGAETAAHFQTRAQLILHGGKLTLPLLLCFKLHGLRRNYCVVRP